MSAAAQTLQIRTSPHIRRGHGVDVIMFNVALALLPTAGFAVWAFGWSALATLVVGVGSCVGTERLACRATGRESTIADGSALVTGLLLALTLPPACPLWMVALGGVVAVGLGKLVFGGLGRNPFNPALVGRAFLQAAFPAAITHYGPAFSPGRFASLPSSSLAPPFGRPEFDAVTGATPLARWKFEGELTAAGELAFGFVEGSAGETCALLIALGGVYLVVRNMMSWRIPAAILGTVALASGVLHAVAPESYAPARFMLLSGGLMLGATFMATDMVGSPLTHLGCWLYGALIGGLIVVIRVWGAQPEGVMYAILLGNAAAPLIDRRIQPRVFGARPAESTP